ncbi:MAG: Gx transporter family protein [Spirochaetales bacterium]|jgi:heptaprenyl diphosphate synthase|nr:Gx transporter family protein [Spirochaetales bacterium]
MPQHIDKSQLAFFSAFCLFLSTLEFLIPKPLPFLRIGLANLPLLVSLKSQPPRFTVALCLLKIAGQAVVGGSLFSYIFLFSAAGSLASVAVMLGCGRLFGEKMTLAGIGVLGSLASNVTQIFLARSFFLGEGAVLIAPPFLLIGCATGLFLGLFAQAALEKSQWIRVLPPRPEYGRAEGRQPREARRAYFIFLCGLVSVFPFIYTGPLAAKAVLSVLYMALARFSGRKIRILPNAVLLLTVTALHCLRPFGKVIFMLGSWPLTEGALETGLLRSLTLIGLVYLSRLTVRPQLRFPGRAGGIFSAMLCDFERITGCGLRIRRKDFWADLDRLFAAVYESGAPPVQTAAAVCTGSGAGSVFSRYAPWALFALANWAVYVAARF